MGSSLCHMMTRQPSEHLEREEKTPACLKGHAGTRTSAASTSLHYTCQVQFTSPLKSLYSIRRIPTCVCINPFLLLHCPLQIATLNPPLSTTSASALSAMRGGRTVRPTAEAHLPQCTHHLWGGVGLHCSE